MNNYWLDRRGRVITKRYFGGHLYFVQRIKNGIEEFFYKGMWDADSAQAFYEFEEAQAALEEALA